MCCQGISFRIDKWLVLLLLSGTVLGSVEGRRTDGDREKSGVAQEVVQALLRSKNWFMAAARDTTPTPAAATRGYPCNI
jgi:hypothetical protein